jgi:acyl-CoA reductase-like NAD-dependent aldehyde dehydrogenase
MPFGGFKDSGMWRECGQDGLRPYLEAKSIYMNTAKQPFAWG